MATAVIMPRQGQSVESCIITSWSKQVGDKVAKGDVLFSYETDKSAFDEVSEVEGTLLKILAGEGDEVPCLDVVCIIGAQGEDISALVGKTEAAPAAEPKSETSTEPTPAAPSQEVVSTASESTSDKLKISPRAKNLVLKTDADISRITPTGPEGRIIERDVVRALDAGFVTSAANAEAYLKGDMPAVKKEAVPAPEAPVTPTPDTAAAPAASATGYTDVKLPQIRKVIAKSMHASLSEMAQLTLNASFDATAIMNLRAAIKTGGEAMGIGNVTINDMILFAAAKILKKHKDLNAHYLGETIRYFDGVHMGVAVDTERGLMVPTIFDADKLSLSELAKASKEIIKEAQAGTISPDKLKGASFTVSNLGPTGIESFTPVINPPQTGILGVCSLTKRVKEVSGAPVFYPCIPLSLTFDHRALDGAPAARFLHELCTALENFNLLLVK